MKKNIEIKARAHDFEKQRTIAESLCKTTGEELHQEDIFFSVQKGRLKLRIQNDAKGELISYSRADSNGPRSSEYSIAYFHDPIAIKEVLSSALPVRGVVKKNRTLYLIGNTRIHFDQVEGLGEFVELEYVVQGGVSDKEGHRCLNNLMDRLSIRKQDLVSQAYIDLLTGGR